MSHKVLNTAAKLRSMALLLFGAAGLWQMAGIPAWGQLPFLRLMTAYPPGGKQASAVEVTVTGNNMDGVDRLFFSHPSITGSPLMSEGSRLQPTPRPVPGKFKVTIAPDVPPGVYELRLVGHFGVSNARAFMVGDREEVLSEDKNHTLPKAMRIPLGVTVNGRSDEGTADFFKFEAQQGQRVILKVLAQRIDSKMDATLVLCDASGRELQSDRDSYRLDPFLDFLVPATGQYIVKIYDYLYRGGPEYAYRLSLGTQPHISYIFPPAGLPGSRQTYVVYGQNLPGGKVSSVLNAQGVPLEEKAVEITLPRDAQLLPANSFLEPRQIVAGGIDYRLSSPEGISNSASLGFATAPVVRELEPNNQPQSAQKVSLPCEIQGQFFPQADQDWIVFEAKKGASYWIEVFSHRLGLPTDPVVVLQRLSMDAEGQEQPQLVAASDDDGSFLGDERYSTGSRDPFFQFKAEQDGIYRLKIHDLAATRESRPSHLYRLSIRQSDPDFHLLVATDDPGGSNDDGNIWEPLLRLGGKTRMNVMAIRRDGFAGKIDIEVKGLPSGISFPGATIPEKSNGTYLFFEASREAAGWTGAVQVIGRARIDGRVVERQARYATLVWNSGSLRQAGAQSRVVRNRTLAVSRSELAPKLPEFRIEKQDWNVPLEGNLEIPFQLARRSLLPGDLRLRLGTFDGLREATTKLVVDDKSSEGTLIYKVTKRGNEFKPGKYTFSAVALSQITYRNQPEAVAQALQERVRLQKLAEQKTAMAGRATRKAVSQSRSELAAQAREAERERRAAERRLREAIAKASPRKIRMAAHSRALDVTIHPAPIVLTGQEKLRHSRAGANLELPLSIDRLFDYAEPVEIGLKVPTHIVGIQAESVTIPKSETTAALLIRLSSDLDPGDYPLMLEATLQLNEQEIQVEEPLTIRVHPLQDQTSLKRRP